MPGLAVIYYVATVLSVSSHGTAVGAPIKAILGSLFGGEADACFDTTAEGWRGSHTGRMNGSLQPRKE